LVYFNRPPTRPLPSRVLSEFGGRVFLLLSGPGGCGDRIVTPPSTRISPSSGWFFFFITRPSACKSRRFFTATPSGSHHDLVGVLHPLYFSSMLRRLRRSTLQVPVGASALPPPTRRSPRVSPFGGIQSHREVFFFSNGESHADRPSPNPLVGTRVLDIQRLSSIPSFFSTRCSSAMGHF